MTVEELEEQLEQLITKRLDGMPNYEEYMVRSTMKVLLIQDLVGFLVELFKQYKMEVKKEKS